MSAMTEARETEILCKIAQLTDVDEALGFREALQDSGEWTAVVRVAMSRRLFKLDEEAA